MSKNDFLVYFLLLYFFIQCENVARFVALEALRDALYKYTTTTTTTTL